MPMVCECSHCGTHNDMFRETCWKCGASFNASEVEAAEPTAGAVGVRSSAVVRPPSSGGQPERETGGQLRIRPPLRGKRKGESEAISRASGRRERTWRCPDCGQVCNTHERPWKRCGEVSSRRPVSRRWPNNTP